MRITIKKMTLTHLFSGYIVLIPILQYYRSPLGAFNLATFIAIILILVFLFAGKLTFNKNMCRTPAWVFLLFITANVVTTGIIYGYSLDWNNYRSYVRLIVIFLSILLFGYEYFDVEYGMRALEKVLVISAFGIFFHVILYSVTGQSIHLIITQLTTSDTITIGRTIRSGGLYMEPAHYAQNAILYSSFYLFSEKYRSVLSKNSFYIIIAGIIVSTSGQGYAMLAVLYAMWLMINTFIPGVPARRKLVVLFSIVAVIVLIFIVMQIPAVQLGWSRIYDDESGLGGSALSKRTWTNYMFDHLDEQQKLLGVGFGHLTEITHGYYMNSMYSYLVQCGYGSLVVFTFIVGYYFLKGPLQIKVHVLLFAVMYAFSGIASAMILSFYLIIYSKTTSLKILEERKYRNE